MRRTTLPGNRVHAFDILRSVVVEELSRHPYGFILFYTWPQRTVNLVINRVDHASCMGQQADFFGEIQLKNVVSTSQGFSGAGAIEPGESWNFQVWYRDPNGPCNSTFNLTNAVPVDFYASGGAGNHDELAGRPLGEYPWFEYVRAFNQGDPVSFAIDPGLRPALMGSTSDVYIVSAKDQAGWTNDPSLLDVRGAASSHTFNGASVQGNTFLLDPGFLSGTAGADVGIGYDIVIDLDGDGQYDAFWNALHKVFRDQKIDLPKLIDYAVRIPPGSNSDALCETTIIWRTDKQDFATRGLDSDQTVSAIKATEKMLNIIYP